MIELSKLKRIKTFVERWEEKVYKIKSAGAQRMWDNRTEKERIAISRKKSKSMMIRKAERPPRMTRDINKLVSERWQELLKTERGELQGAYNGYIAKKTMSDCTPEKRERIVRKRAIGTQLAWDRLTEKERKKRASPMVESNKVRKLFYKKDVPRKNTYCGVITEPELESMENNG